MEIKVVYIVIHDATVDQYVSASWKCFSIAENTLMCCGQVSRVRHCSGHDHYLLCGQTVPPRGHVITTLQCISINRASPIRYPHQTKGVNIH